MNVEAEVRRLPLLPAGSRRVVQVVLDNEVRSCSAVACTNAQNQAHIDPGCGDPYVNINNAAFDRLRRCCVLSNPAHFVSSDTPVFERAITGSASPFDQPLLRWCEDLEHVRRGDSYADAVETYQKADQEVGEYQDLLAAFPNADAVEDYQKADQEVGRWQDLVRTQGWPQASSCLVEQQGAPVLTARWEHKGIFLSAHCISGRTLLIAYGDPKSVIDACSHVFSSRNVGKGGSHVQRRMEASPSAARARSSEQAPQEESEQPQNACLEFSSPMKDFAALSAEAVMETETDEEETNEEQRRIVRSYAMHWLSPELPGNFKHAATGTISLMSNEEDVLSDTMLAEYARDYGRMVGKEVISVLTRAGDTEMHSLESLLPTSKPNTPLDGDDAGGGGGRAPDKTTTHTPRSRSKSTDSTASSTDLFGEELMSSSRDRLSVDSASSWLSNRSSVESIDEVEGYNPAAAGTCGTPREKSVSPSPTAKTKTGRLRRLSLTMNLGSRSGDDDRSDDGNAVDEEGLPPPHQFTPVSPAVLRTMTPRAVQILTASDEEKRAALALTIRTCLLDEGMLLDEQALDLCCRRVLANLTVTPAMNLVIESGCSPAVYQPRFVLLCGSGQLRVLTVAFIGGPTRGDRPDTKCTPFMLRMLSPNLIPSDGDDDDSGGNGGGSGDSHALLEGVPPSSSSGSLTPEPEMFEPELEQVVASASSPGLPVNPGLQPKALVFDSSAPVSYSRRRTEYRVGFTQCESTQDCIEQGVRWMQEAVASGNYSFDLDSAPTSRYYKVNAMREWLGNPAADVVVAQKDKPTFHGQLAFVGHVVVGMARPAKVGQLLAARLRGRLHQLDPATPVNIKKKLDAEVLPEVAKLVNKVTTDEELKGATAGLARTAKSLVVGTEGFTQVTSLLASPSSKTAGLPYKVLRRAMMRSAAEIDSSKLGYLEANRVVFVLEKKTLPDGHVRMRFGNKTGDMHWVSQVTPDGETILLRLGEDTASVDAAELLKGSSALLKGLLTKTANLEEEEKANLKIHGGKLLQGAKEVSPPTSRVLTEGEKLLSAASLSSASHASTAKAPSLPATPPSDAGEEGSTAATGETMSDKAVNVVESLLVGAEKVENVELQRVLTKARTAVEQTRGAVGVGKTDDLALLQAEGAEILASTATAEELIDALAAHPEFLRNVKIQVVRLIEDSIAGAEIPPISGDKSWGSYTIDGVQIRRLAVPAEQVNVNVAEQVTVTVSDLALDLKDFQWTFRKAKGFPKFSDDGVANAKAKGLNMKLTFELVTSAEAFLAVDNVRASLELHGMDVAVLQSSAGSKVQWLYNKLLGVFSTRVRGVVEGELRLQLEEKAHELKSQLRTLVAGLGKEIGESMDQVGIDRASWDSAEMEDSAERTAALAASGLHRARAWSVDMR